MEERRKDYVEIAKRFSGVELSLTDIKVSQARLEERQVAIDKRINGSIDDIQTHIGHGGKWQMAVAGVAIILLINIGAELYQYGRICERLDRVCTDVEKIKK